MKRVVIFYKTTVIFNEKVERDIADFKATPKYDPDKIAKTDSLM